MGLLYDRYARPLYGIIYRIVRSQEIAEDLLQETFLRIWERIDQFDIDRGELFTWIVTIARNLALDKVKSKAYQSSKKNRNVDEIVDTTRSERSISYNPETIGVKESVEQLEPDLRTVVETLYFRGYTQSEAAEELDLPLGTLKTRARKALGLLRQKLGAQKRI